VSDGGARRHPEEGGEEERDGRWRSTSWASSRRGLPVGGASDVAGVVERNICFEDKWKEPSLEYCLGSEVAKEEFPSTKQP